MLSTIAERYAQLCASVDDELRACGRPAGSVTILGVSKKQPAQAIFAAANAGLTDIGENYVQEAQSKFVEQSAGGECVLDRIGLRKHFIGHVQTNKAKTIVQLFDVVQTVDRLDAAVALAKAAQAARAILPVLLQVNISPNERYGCPPAEAERLAEALRGLASLRLDGVMAIGPLTQDRDLIQRAFELAAKTFGAVGGNTLSIGMSGDWREAIRAGSTMIRIGSALFGERGA